MRNESGSTHRGPSRAKRHRLAVRRAPSGPEPGANGKEPSAAGMNLGRVVALSGVPASTVHHYRRLGLLPRPKPADQGRFSYGEVHVRALRLIRSLRQQRGLSLRQIKSVLPGLLEGKQEDLPVPSEEGPEARRIDAAFRLFSEPKGYASVTVSEIAAEAGVAKGSVYRHFASKEALFTAVVEAICRETAERFAQSVADLGGPQAVASDPSKAALVFGREIAPAMPVLLELGARAARGDAPSQALAAWVLRTLAEAAGRPLSASSDDPVPAGLQVIQWAFANVLQWAVGPDWSVGPDWAAPAATPTSPGVPAAL
jgi:AcrR family transcriptional regulator